MENQDQHHECWYCHEEMVETQPRSELPCHHFLHTTCFINIVHYNTYNSCALCNTIFNQNPIDEIEETQVPDTTRIQNLYDTNEQFKNLAKKLVQKRRLYGKERTRVTKFVREKKNEIREQLLVLKAQVEGLTSLKKNEVFQSQEYKDYVKAKRSYTVIKTKLERDHNCSPKALARALHEKPGFRRFNPHQSWRHRSYYLFQRAWHFYIPV